ncbi:MAG: multidrug ABC transporter permease [Bacteroidia bacterium]|nr:MAG: multidrug ABC transporter permease [Bacteroidia bacterium]
MMTIPFKYIVRSLFTRRLTTFITISGLALVVFVFVAVLMLANGIRQTLIATGSEENVLVARKAANGEISSIIPNETYGIITSLPQVARNAEGRPLATGDVVAVINLNKIGTDGGLSNVTVRGVSPAAFELRPQVKIVEGRMFNWGAREIIVGASIERRFEGTQVGQRVKFAGDQWTIVGKFETGGDGFNSEMWADVRQIQDAFSRGSSSSTVTFRLTSPDALPDLQRTFEQDNRLQEFEIKTEKQFFADQSEFMAVFLSVLGIFITVFFSVGAVIGAMITMYAAVANRTVEIGTMRALGFRRRSVLMAFLTESLIISVIGAGVGLFLASFLQFLRVSTLNFGSFSELEFSFALTSDTVIAAIVFALLMGFVGGFLPSIRAARLNIVNALRSV